MPNSEQINDYLGPGGLSSVVVYQNEQVVGPDGVIPLVSKISAAITAAKGNNPIELDPWLLPEAWVTGTTYYEGQIVSNAAGNAYMRWPNQTGGVVAGATEPVHQTPTPTLDGVGGNYWHYLGKARGLAAGSYSCAMPAAATDTMAGRVAIGYVATHAVATTLGLSQYKGSFTFTNTPFRYIGLRDESLADSVEPAMLGPNAGSVATPNYATAGIRFGVHFKTNSRWIFIKPAAEIPVQASGNDRLSMEVNGRFISDTFMIKLHTDPGASDSGYLLDLSKYSGVVKDVKIYGRDSVRNYVSYQLYMEPTAFIQPGEAVNDFKIAFEGDSLTAGGNGLPSFNGDFWTHNTALLLGASSWYSNAVGTTGFVSNASGTKTTYLERIDRINSFAPDVLVVMGGYNDGGYTSPQRQAAVLAYLQAFRASNPNAYIFMFGNLMLHGSTLATYQTSEADIEAAVTTFNDDRCVFVPILTDDKGSWYAGGITNGNYFYTTGSAPFADTHHTIGAYKMLESQVTAAIRGYFAS